MDRVGDDSAVVSASFSDYMRQGVPQLVEPIEWREGLIVVGNTAAGTPVTPDLVDLLRAMIRRMNDASRDLPELHACTDMACGAA
eukprot:jgi/Ulvmu1/11797/UM080_0008.1